MATRVVEGGLYPELCLSDDQLYHESQNPPAKSDESEGADSAPTGSQQTCSQQTRTACDGEGEILLMVVVAFSSHVRTLGECLTIHSLPALFF